MLLASRRAWRARNAHGRSRGFDLLESRVLLTYVDVVNNGPSANRVDMVFIGDGYTAADISQGTYAGNVQSLLQHVFNQGQDPFPRYAKFFDVHEINVVSQDSGVTTPQLGIVKNTALHSTYRYDGFTDRLLYLDDSKADAIVGQELAGAPFVPEMRFAVANSAVYGGGGGEWAMYAGGDPSSTEIALHEQGHSFIDLADEYGGNPGTYPYSEPAALNLTRDPSGAKWAPWLGYNQPGLGVVGAYEGGGFYDHGIYRPTLDSKMRTLDQPFNAIAREAFVQQIYHFVHPLDAYTPNTSTLFSPASLSVTPVDPAVIGVDWYVDGQLVQQDGSDSLTAAALGLTPGTHTVNARAYDRAITPALDWVRSQRDTLTQTVEWTVSIDPNPNHAPTNLALAATVAAASLPASTTVGTLSATDPNAGDHFTYALAAGPGSSDNASFKIATNALQSAVALDFSAHPAYSVRVRTTDAGGLYAEKAFVISRPLIVSQPIKPFTTNLGDTAVFTLALPHAPASNVTVTLTRAGAHPGAGTLSAATLTFTPANFATPQTVTVTGVDSGAASVQAFSVHLATASSDLSFNGFQSDVPLTNFTGLVRVYNIVNTDFHVHFYTTSKAEHDLLLGLANAAPVLHHPWNDSETTDTSFAMFKSNPGTGNVLYVNRLYNPNTAEHYYTLSLVEADAISAHGTATPQNKLGYVWENQAGTDTAAGFQGYLFTPADFTAKSTDNPVGPIGSLPIFRLYNTLANPSLHSGDHTITNDQSLYVVLRAQAGWQEHTMVGFGVQIGPLASAVTGAAPAVAGQQEVSAPAVSAGNRPRPAPTPVSPVEPDEDRPLDDFWAHAALRPGVDHVDLWQ